MPLVGGNLSGSVRIGDTVHRRAGAWTPAVHALLAHLQRVGFNAAPQALGFDDQGRAVQSFLPGEVHPGWPDPLPQWMFEDEVTPIAAAELLRRYHDALDGFVPPRDAHWRFVPPVEHEVICHNDWSPSNALFRGHVPVAMLDWDAAGAVKASRFARFCDAYGEGIARQDVFDTLTAQLPLHADLIQAEADAGDPGFAKLVGWNVPARIRDDTALLIHQRDALVR